MENKKNKQHIYYFLFYLRDVVVIAAAATGLLLRGSNTDGSAYADITSESLLRRPPACAVPAAKGSCTVDGGDDEGC